MDVKEAIKARRSIRRFKKDPIPEDLLREVLEAATWAPSAGNVQPWQFYVITQAEKRKGLSKAGRQGFLGEAPVIIVVCALLERAARYYGERGKSLYCLQDSAAAIQNLLLRATSLGLSTCWVGAFSETQVKEILGLPPEARPVALIPLGYPAENPLPPPRRGLSEVVVWEK